MPIGRDEFFHTRTLHKEHDMFIWTYCDAHYYLPISQVSSCRACYFFNYNEHLRWHPKRHAITWISLKVSTHCFVWQALGAIIFTVLGTSVVRDNVACDSRTILNCLLWYGMQAIRLLQWCVLVTEFVWLNLWTWNFATPRLGPGCNSIRIHSSKALA